MRRKKSDWLKAADPDHLRWLYVDRGLTSYDIARMFDCSSTTVQKYLFKELRIPPKEDAIALKLKRKRGKV